MATRRPKKGGGARRGAGRSTSNRPQAKRPAAKRSPAQRSPAQRGPAKAAEPPPSVEDTLDEQGEEYVARFVDIDRPDAANAPAPAAVPDGADDEATSDAEAIEAAVEAAPGPDDVVDEGVPLIAIVGRPNVGKSRLFNRMTGTRFAIVEDLEGVTRDRQYGEGTWDGRRFQVVDTGGFEPESTDELLAQMRDQARLAMEEADIVLHIVDGQTGIVPADRDIASMLRRSNKPVWLVVNKIDGPRHEVNVAEFWELGLDDVHPLSAEHGNGYADLLDSIAPFLPKGRIERDRDDLIRVAVVGKPNAGKSTLINRLLGEDRLLTSDIPGTTRDAINTWLEHDDQRYLFIDTAGVRRKRGINEAVEKYAVVQAFKAIDRADVVIYMLDATVGVTSQDQRIAGLVRDKGRAMVILLNKWDAVAKDARTADEYIRRLREQLKFAHFAPVMTVSAKTGQRIHKLYPLIQSAFASYIARTSTSKVNDVVRAAVRRNPPKPRRNKRLKVFYASQVATRPPTMMFVVNDPELVHFSYERYLYNSCRAAWGFEGSPLKIFFRPRKKDDPDDPGSGR